MRKDNRKESLMFWLRKWNYLITSSSSSTLLHNMLSFRSDVWQCLFYLLIACIQQFYWLIILLSNIFSRFGVESSQTLEQKKEISVQGKEIIVFLVGALKQCQKFFCSGKICEVTPALNLDKQTMKINSRLNTVMFNQYFLILWCFYSVFSIISYVKRIGFVKHIK